MANKKQITYSHVFGSEMGKEVLADLRIICNATKTTIRTDNNGSIDAIATAREEGRRDVFLHILNTINIDFDDVYNMENDYED